ncbi:hypothetical protein Rsub_08248 [Raphidocelis subcapitata]|uniref:Uncharacterized protein n=1 Tax=Raphidocelis subcapitata TaxID=307507 RepID=A0A2V0PA39_9CHLO|nr:hypothetical protein Rsub_08248 [Raphidocelis subcapitata]|eukprot:GBF95812.1 hypothetical protein Rsub_08248 [Raphidocelis subcapitata]
MQQLGRVRMRAYGAPTPRARARAVPVRVAASALGERPAAAAAAAAQPDWRTLTCERARAADAVMRHLLQLETPAADGSPSWAAGCVHRLPCPPPPPAWRRFAAAVARRGLAAVKAELSEALVVLPEEGDRGCYLARHGWVHPLRDPGLAAFLASLFAAATDPRGWAAAGLWAPGGGFSPPSLSRHDLFHAHLFVCRRTGGVGLLFHASEYPAYDPFDFPIILGNCHRGSALAFNQRAMDLRNLVFFNGHLAVLDVGEGTPLHSQLLHDGTRPARTVYEEDFGQPVADVFYMPGWRGGGSGSGDGDGDGDGLASGTASGSWDGGGGGSVESSSGSGSFGGDGLRRTDSGASDAGSGGGGGGWRPGPGGGRGRGSAARGLGARSPRSAGSSGVPGEEVRFLFGRPPDCCGVYVSY